MRVWRTHHVLDPETAQRVTEVQAIDRIPIPEQILWRSDPRKRLADLLPRPGRGWMVGGVEMHHATPASSRPETGSPTHRDLWSATRRRRCWRAACAAPAQAPRARAPKPAAQKPVRRRTGRRFRARGAVERPTLYRDRQCLCGRQRTLRQPVRQRLAVEQLHDEERRAVVLADVVQRTDVRVGQLRDRARFAIEALAELRVRGQRWPSSATNASVTYGGFFGPEGAVQG